MGAITTLAIPIFYHFFLRLSFAFPEPVDIYLKGWSETRFLVFTAVIRFLYEKKPISLDLVEKKYGHFIKYVLETVLHLVCLEITMALMWCNFEIFLNKIIFTIAMNSEVDLYRRMNGDLITNILLMVVAVGILSMTLLKTSFFKNWDSVYATIDFAYRRALKWLLGTALDIRTKSAEVLNRFSATNVFQRQWDLYHNIIYFYST